MTDPSTWFDAETELPGRAFWEAVLGAESARSRRFHRPATVVLVELVGFDDIVSGWGRSVAVRDLVAVGRILRADCRASDYVVRLAEARFAILLTETDQIAAINVVERLRARCERETGSRSVATRLAFGWASPAGEQTVAGAVDQAEQRLRHEAESAAR